MASSRKLWNIIVLCIRNDSKNTKVENRLANYQEKKTFNVANFVLWDTKVENQCQKLNSVCVRKLKWQKRAKRDRGSYHVLLFLDHCRNFRFLHSQSYHTFYYYFYLVLYIYIYMWATPKSHLVFLHLLRFSLSFSLQQKQTHRKKEKKVACFCVC